MDYVSFICSKWDCCGIEQWVYISRIFIGDSLTEKNKLFSNISNSKVCWPEYHVPIPIEDSTNIGIRAIKENTCS